ncbi:MAG: hypothetical protein CK428_00915 [Mycobacterium sp.]|nr:MAG: hypothetical protein CK428_00915 [Mycobacterium sp.]
MHVERGLVVTLRGDVVAHQACELGARHRVDADVVTVALQVEDDLQLHRGLTGDEVCAAQVQR